MIRSLKAYGLLSDAETGKYVVDAELIDVDQPIIGFTFTVDSTVDYTVKNASTESVVYKNKVVESGTATMSDAVSGVTRLRMANEVSVKNNIKAFIEGLLKK